MTHIGIELGTNEVRAVRLSRDHTTVEDFVALPLNAPPSGFAFSETVRSALHDLGIAAGDPATIAVAIGRSGSGVSSDPGISDFLDELGNRLGEPLLQVADRVGRVAYAPSGALGLTNEIFADLGITVECVELPPVAAARLVPDGSPGVLRLHSGVDWAARIVGGQLVEALVAPMREQTPGVMWHPSSSDSEILTRFPIVCDLPEREQPLAAVAIGAALALSLPNRPLQLNREPIRSGKAGTSVLGGAAAPPRASSAPAVLAEPAIDAGATRLRTRQAATARTDELAKPSRRFSPATDLFPKFRKVNDESAPEPDPFEDAPEFDPKDFDVPIAKGKRGGTSSGKEKKNGVGAAATTTGKTDKAATRDPVEATGAGATANGAKTAPKPKATKPQTPPTGENIPSDVPKSKAAAETTKAGKQATEQKKPAQAKTPKAKTPQAKTAQAKTPQAKTPAPGTPSNKQPTAKAATPPPADPEPKAKNPPINAGTATSTAQPSTRPKKVAPAPPPSSSPPATKPNTKDEPAAAVAPRTPADSARMALPTTPPAGNAAVAQRPDAEVLPLKRKQQGDPTQPWGDEDITVDRGQHLSAVEPIVPTDERTIIDEDDSGEFDVEAILAHGRQQATRPRTTLRDLPSEFQTNEVTQLPAPKADDRLPTPASADEPDDGRRGVPVPLVLLLTVLSIVAIVLVVLNLDRGSETTTSVPVATVEADDANLTDGAVLGETTDAGEPTDAATEETSNSDEQTEQAADEADPSPTPTLVTEAATGQSVASLADLPPRRSVLRNNILYLEGALPNQELVDLFDSRARLVAGEQNVINNLVVHTEAPAPTDGNVVVESAVVFPTGATGIPPEAAPTMNGALALMQLYPQVTLVVEGHSDSDGTPEQNLATSQDRANTVVAWLAASGISPDRIDVVGFGDTQPIASNDTEQGRAANRRVDLRYIDLLSG